MLDQQLVEADAVDRRDLGWTGGDCAGRAGESVEHRDLADDRTGSGRPDRHNRAVARRLDSYLAVEHGDDGSGRITFQEHRTARGVDASLAARDHRLPYRFRQLVCIHSFPIVGSLRLARSRGKENQTQSVALPTTSGSRRWNWSRKSRMP